MNDHQEKELTEKLNQYRSQKSHLERLQRLRRLHQTEPIILEGGYIKVVRKEDDKYASCRDTDFFDTELVNKIKLLLATSFDQRIEEVKGVIEQL